MELSGRRQGGQTSVMCITCAVIGKLLRRQRRIIKTQITILERIETMSQVLDQIKDYAAKIDEATNAIAVRIQVLIDKVNSGTATPEEIAAVLQPEVDRLSELGKDPVASA
jgi:hypothetical protein